MSRRPTEKQLQVLEVLSEYQESRHPMPTLSELADKFGVSIPAIDFRLDALERKRYITREKGAHRSIFVLRGAEFNGR